MPSYDDASIGFQKNESIYAFHSVQKKSTTKSVSWCILILTAISTGVVFASYVLWSCNLHLLRSLNMLWTFYDSSNSLVVMVNIDINSIQDKIQHFCSIYVYLLSAWYVCCVRKSLLWLIMPYLWCRFNWQWRLKSIIEWVVTRFVISHYFHFSCLPIISHWDWGSVISFG